MNIYNIVKVFIFLFFPLFLFSQIKECEIIQINWSKNSDTIFSCLKEYDINGNVIFENFIEYKFSEISGYPNGKYYYKYTDGKLLEKIFVYKLKNFQNESNVRFDTTKYTYIYQNDLKVKELKHEFRTSIKSHKGCEPRYPEDYGPREWRRVGGKSFFYNKNGQLNKEIRNDLYSINKFIYNERGKLKNKFHYKDTTLIWTESYTYGKNKNILNRVWSEPYEKNIWKYINVLNDVGQIIHVSSHLLRDGNYELHSYVKKGYDSNDNLVNLKYFNSKDKLVLEHIYRYIYFETIE